MTKKDPPIRNPFNQPLCCCVCTHRRALWCMKYTTPKTGKPKSIPHRISRPKWCKEGKNDKT